MLNLRKTEITHEELFIRSYGRLLGWSVHLTGGDRTAAEDLLHDVYVLFSLHRPDISSIDNLEGYLYTMLRNLHISRLRRAARSPLKQLSVVDLDSAERVLHTLTTEDVVLVQDQLRAVCRYACARREKAKAACALILRFFLGYYPSEVARVLKTTRPAVDVLLLRARNEVKLFLENPRALGLLEGRLPAGPAPAGFARPPGGFLDELRQTVYQSRLGPCLSRARLKELYRPGAVTQPEQPQLAHVVSCPGCLDAVNALLGIPLLSERHPADSITRDSRGGGGRGDGGRPVGGAGGGVTPPQMKRLRRSAGEVFEHKPQELCVSVNGHVRGSHRVNSERSELSLIVETSEPIGFVEVFSEQDVRLLMLPVTAPPKGAGEQAAGVGLSDGRRLDISLNFQSPWPAVHVLYYDPTYREVEELASGPLKLEEAIAGGDAEALGRAEGQRRGPGILGAAAARLKGRLPGGFWLRPGAVTAALALLLITSLLVWRSQGPASVSAAELLSRSASVEEAGAPGAVTHSIIRLEERQAGGPARSGRQIQVWRSAGEGLTVRRLYDEHGRLMAGEWRSADGARSVYLSPRARAGGPRDDGDGALKIDDVWRLGLSARDFTVLVGRDANGRAEERGDSYVLTYEGGAEAAAAGLARATLVLNRHNLRATGQSLTVRQGESERHFVFTEVLYESWPKGSAPPKVFERDAEFGDAGAAGGEQPAAGATTSKAEAPAPPAPDERATMALEVEVLKLLNQAGADLGEQVSVARTPQGSLRVQAVVDTEGRKAQILSALAPVMGERAVSVEVVTAVEAQRLKAQTQRPPGAATVRQFEPGDDHVPADAELRRHLRARGKDDEQLEADVLRFSVRASTHSRNALQHAWALKRLAGRFSARELDSLDAESRLKWLSMVREHADAVRRETAALRRQLQPVFPPERAARHGGDPAAPSAAGVAASAARLLELCSTVDAITSTAFTVSSGPSAPAEVRSARYWRALLGAEMLAEQLRRFAQESPRSNRTPP